MIVTVTPNPSIDRTLEVPTLRRGHVNRMQARRDDAGGKGINVSKALCARGIENRCVVPWGGADGGRLLALLLDAGIDVVDMQLTGLTRINVSVTEPDGTVTKLNEPGPTLSDGEVHKLLALVADAADGADWIVTSGSLPPGAPIDLHAQIVRIGHEVGARVAVDTSGLALVSALAERPDLVKPNAEELAQATGADIRTVGDAVDAARQLVEHGASTVLASLGAQGAVVVGDGPLLHAHATVAHPVSAVGAGDATLAGWISADGADPTTCLRHAVASGTAAVALPGTRMPRPSDIDLDAVRCTDHVDLHRPLGEPPARP